MMTALLLLLKCDTFNYLTLRSTNKQSKKRLPGCPKGEACWAPNAGVDCAAAGCDPPKENEGVDVFAEK